MKIKITLLFISFFIVQFITAQEINYKIKIEYLTTIEWQIPQTYTSEMYVSESLSCFFFKKATKGGFIPDYESNTFEVNIASRFPNYHLKTESNFLSLEQVFSKHFLVVDSLPRINWLITDETKYYNEQYLCKKATGYFKGRNYIVWFAEEIPLSLGPWKLGGLPGLIVEAVDDTKEISFKLKSLKNNSGSFNLSTNKIKRITWDEYKTIWTTKMKTFKTYMESDPDNEGDVSVKISNVKTLEKTLFQNKDLK